MEPPLYSTEYSRGFGTLYTAVYRPADGVVTYHWPGVDLDAVVRRVPRGHVHAAASASRPPRDGLLQRAGRDRDRLAVHAARASVQRNAITSAISSGSSALPRG